MVRRFGIVVFSLVAIVCIVAAVVVSQFIAMPGSSFHGKLPPLGDEQQAISHRLQKHVEMLSTTIGERNSLNMERLDDAASYIKKNLVDSGYQPSVQEFDVGSRRFENIEARRLNSGGKGQPGGVYVFGAHYDSVTQCPGANDNGSGVAAVLEMARIIAGKPESELRKLCPNGLAEMRFVFFPNEEPPFFGSEAMGSFHYAQQCKQNKDPVRGMISVETIGYYSDKKGSQRYPAPFNMFYPDTGNFVAFVGNTNSRAFLLQCIKSFRDDTQFPSEGIAAPEAVRGVGWSDQRCFWAAGYNGIMVTDTAPFRYPDYHLSTDTADKVDYDKTARVVLGLTDLAIKLAATP